MPSAPISKLHKSINGVRRRMWLQSLVNHLIWCWAGVLLLAALWFFVQPLMILEQMASWQRWSILGGALGVGAVLALVVTWLRSPSRLTAALALDEKFGLKERVTTSLTLTDEQTQSPAGQALLADVQKHVESLQVRSKFPLRISWQSLLCPVGAAVLAVLALLFQPDFNWLTPDTPNNNQLSAAEVQEAQKHLDQLRKLKKEKKDADTPKSKALKEIEAEWKKLLEQQIDPKDKEQLREHAQKIRDLEEKMKDRLNKLAAMKQKKNRLEKQLDQLEALRGKKTKDGPAKDMLEALRKNDMKKAQEELQKLQKKLENKKLSKDELKKLEEQLRDLQKQLKRLEDERARKKEQLEREKELGGLDDKQMEELERELEQMKDLEEVADMLQECQNCLQQGDGKKLAGKLRDLMGRMKNVAGELKKLEGELDELTLTDEEMRKLEEDQKLLEEVREGLCKCLGDGQKAGRFPGGKRSKGKEEATVDRNARQDSKVDPKGDFKITGFTRGGSFRKIPAKEIPGTFRRTAQEAQRAIETQRISPAEAEMLKGYYENLGGRNK